MSKILKLNSYSQHDELGDRDYMVYEVEYSDGHKEYVSRDVFRHLKALEIIKNKNVDTRALIEILKKEWTWEQYMDEEDDINTGGHQFSRDRLTREEYNLLKEVWR